MTDTKTILGTIIVGLVFFLMGVWLFYSSYKASQKDGYKFSDLISDIASLFIPGGGPSDKTFIGSVSFIITGIAMIAMTLAKIL